MRRGPKIKYPNGGTTRINLTVSRTVWDQATDIADHAKVSLSAEVNQMLVDWIAKQTKCSTKSDYARENS